MGWVFPSPKNGSSPLPEREHPLLSVGTFHVTMVSSLSPLGLLPFPAMEASSRENGATPTAEREFPFT